MRFLQIKSKQKISKIDNLGKIKCANNTIVKYFQCKPNKFVKL